MDGVSLCPLALETRGGGAWQLGASPLSVARGDAVAAAVADSLHKLRQLTKVRVGLRNNALGPGLEVC